MSSALKRLKTVHVSLLVIAFACSLRAQTYKVGSGSPETPQVNTDPKPPPSKSLGWGSNIQNARLAGAAELALKDGNYAIAVDYAQRAVQATPNDAQLWFLLGYAARLNGKLQVSADAYSRGLRAESVCARRDLWTRSNLQHDGSDCGGRASSEPGAFGGSENESTMRCCWESCFCDLESTPRALDVLGRAEQMQPGARSELLMALVYEHQKQLDLASRYLELAKRHAPDNPDVQRSLAGYYRETGNYPAAIAALKFTPEPEARRASRAGVHLSAQWPAR